MPDTVVLIANGDLRLSANQRCWPAQARAEEAVMNAIRREGRDGAPRPRCDPEKGHGFIDSQKHGMEVFREHSARCAAGRGRGGLAVQPPRAARAVHASRPILTVANWSGEWPGLVGMLNLNASLTKAGVRTARCGARISRTSFFLQRPAPAG